MPGVLERNSYLPWAFLFGCWDDLAYCYPSTLFQIRVFLGQCDAILGSVGRFLSFTPDQNRYSEVSSQNDGTNNLNPKLYGVAFALLLLVAFVLVIKG